MKLHRIVLRNYRGVEASTVEIAGDGVTIIEGRNEVGKSSLAEALDLVLSVPDSSKSSRVRSVQPVHHDVGPEVEVDIESGPYRFRYHKRWLKRAATHLEVLEPQREQLTGRDAHQRVEEILAETLDVDLFATLRFVQGDAVVMPTFELVSLSRALDAAAADDRAGDREDALWAAICAERGRYWTPTGMPRGDRADSARRVAEAETEVAELLESIRQLDAEVAEVADLDARIIAIRAELESQRELAEKLGEEARVTERLHTEVERVGALHAAAIAAVEQATSAAERRQELLDEVSEALDAVEKYRQEAERVAPTRAAAEANLAAAREAAATAHEAWRRAEDRHALAVFDADLRRREIEVEQLTERRDRIVDARSRLALAEGTLAGIHVDESAVAAIEAAHIELVKAEAAAKAGAPTIRVEAFRSLPVEIDGVIESLGPNDHQEYRASERFEVAVEGLMRLEVVPGDDARGLVDRVHEARRELQRRCEAVSAASLSDARALLAQREHAQRERDDSQAAIRRDLRDLSFEELSAKVDRLHERIDEQRRTRAETPPLPVDLSAAQHLVDESNRHLDGLAEVAERADRRVSDAEATQREVSEADITSTLRLEDATAAAARLEDQLEVARQTCPDSELHERVRDASERVAASEAALDAARGALAAADPASLEVRRNNLRSTIDRAEEALATSTERRIKLLTHLELAGEQGLGHQLGAAEAELEHRRRAYEQHEARARAAERLYEVFAARREEARDRYSAPFRTKIEEFGRIVFGPDFSVELDGLRVRTRTLDGVTLDVEELSVGAKEQLGILARLACAVLVAADGGAPVILDDALGWTDQRRLERMGAAISLAARSCQVIVLTCMPSRYASVGNATLVTLDSPSR